ncbi:MAG: hypothetical protein H6Q90_4030 [Deltaproteobacteria bacterium]|nr:hypothetical protein [Deltaproteobacteria bacterium]
MSAVDLPPGIGLVGSPLGVFHAPSRARRLALLAFVVVTVLGVLTWYLVSKHPWRRGATVQIVLPVAFALFALLGLTVRAARIAVTRDGVRWGWTSLGFHQQASRITRAHVYRDGVALEARRGSWWFLAARDWDRFEVLVRQLRRTELTIAEHDGQAPLRARLQSYGRFLDALLVTSMMGAIVIAYWAS